MFVACVLFAGTAAASDGGLVLLPDLTGKLPILIVLFVLLVYPVNAILFKPIFQVLDAREEKTTGTRKRAGFTYCPSLAIRKHTWGPVDRPVEPT